VASVGLEVPPYRVASTRDADGDGLSDLLIEANGPQLVLGPRILWRRRSADAIRAQPVARDFDGDGRIDLAQFAAFGGRPTLHLLHGESGILETSAEPGAVSTIRAPAAIATEDGWDVVHVLGNSLFRFSGRDASVVARVQASDAYASPSIADLDADGRLEVLVASWDVGHELRVHDAATLALEWLRPLSSGAWGEPLALDLDDDTALEIVVSQLDGALVAIDGPDDPALWSVALSARNVFSPLPITWSDGVAALATSAADSMASKTHDLVVLRAKDGRELARLPGLGHPRSRPAASDVDGDGTLDLVVATGQGTVVALGPAGELWRSDRGASVPVAVSTALVAVDLDRDDADEILVGDDDGRLRVLDARTGDVEWSYSAGDTIEAPPLAVDVDLDGIAEVVVGSHDRFLVCLRHIGRARPR
jgi:outer membrane protein assembly factor BamB